MGSDQGGCQKDRCDGGKSVLRLIQSYFPCITLSPVSAFSVYLVQRFIVVSVNTSIPNVQRQAKSSTIGAEIVDIEKQQAALIGMFLTSLTSI